MGVTGVSYAVAETASCAVTPRRGVARLSSLAPPRLVLLIEPEQVLETLDDFFAITRLNRMQARGRVPNYFNFISGPSRTADIEQTLTIGVHGPGEVHMVILG
jgi:L-lactate dehydrogenase complex protein LldG